MTARIASDVRISSDARIAQICNQGSLCFSGNGFSNLLLSLECLRSLQLREQKPYLRSTGNPCVYRYLEIADLKRGRPLCCSLLGSAFETIYSHRSRMIVTFPGFSRFSRPDFKKFPDSFTFSQLSLRDQICDLVNAPAMKDQKQGELDKIPRLDKIPLPSRLSKFTLTSD